MLTRDELDQWRKDPAVSGLIQHIDHLQACLDRTLSLARCMHYGIGNFLRWDGRTYKDAKIPRAMDVHMLHAQELHNIGKEI